MRRTKRGRRIRRREEGEKEEEEEEEEKCTGFIEQSMDRPHCSSELTLLPHKEKFNLTL